MNILAERFDKAEEIILKRTFRKSGGFEEGHSVTVQECAAVRSGNGHTLQYTGDSPGERNRGDGLQHGHPDL